jgi:hypothetical protein
MSSSVCLGGGSRDRQRNFCDLRRTEAVLPDIVYLNAENIVVVLMPMSPYMQHVQ